MRARILGAHLPIANNSTYTIAICMYVYVHYAQMSIEEHHDTELESIARRLRGKVHELEIEILPLQENLSRLRVQLDFVERALSAGAKGPATPAEASDENVSKPNVSDRIFEILRDAGQPLHVTEIRNRYVAKGFTVPGQGTESNLLVYIVRDSRFLRVSKGTYALTEAGVTAKTPAKPQTKRRRRRKP